LKEEKFRFSVTPPAAAKFMAIEQKATRLTALPVLDGSGISVGIPNGNYPFLVVSLNGP
jgi:hypothetical protein